MVDPPEITTLHEGGETKIKVPLTPLGPMGHVALYPNTPPTHDAPTLPRIKAAIDPGEQTGGVYCVCVCVAACTPALQLCNYGCCCNKNKAILPLF